MFIKCVHCHIHSQTVVAKVTLATHMLEVFSIPVRPPALVRVNVMGLLLVVAERLSSWTQKSGLAVGGQFLKTYSPEHRLTRVRY